MMIRRTGLGNPIEVRCPDCFGTGLFDGAAWGRATYGEDGVGVPCDCCAGTGRVYSVFDRHPVPSEREMRRAERIGLELVRQGLSFEQIVGMF